jgi:hypothetical protein
LKTLKLNPRALKTPGSLSVAFTPQALNLKPQIPESQNASSLE